MGKTTKQAELTDKQLAFVGYYLRTFNATESAKLAGYSAKTAQEQGSRLLSNVIIKELIDKKIQEHLMSADEVLIRMSDIARGDIAQLMDVSGFGFNLDMAKAKELGLTKLIKRVKQKTTTYIAKSESEEDREVVELEVDLYDAQSALVTIGKQHGLFSTKVEIKDWQDKVVEGLKQGKLDPLEVKREFGDNLASQLFIRAGVPVSQSGEVVTNDPAPDERAGGE